MNKKELYNYNLYDAINILQEEYNNITSYESLKQFIISELEDNNIYLVKYLIDSINQNTIADYYNYDYGMGILEEPTPITSLEDLEDFCIVNKLRR